MLQSTIRIVSLLLPGTFLMLLACGQQERILEEQNEEEDQIAIDTIEFIALGDSYTIGEGIEESGSWPFQLKLKLEENSDLHVNTEIIARTGWTTRDLINAIDNAALSDLGEERLVSLSIGVNNQFRGLAFDVFKMELDSLLSKAVEIAGSSERVFVVSIPDYGVTPFGQNNSMQIAQELDLYNSYSAARVEELEIPFINITEISRDLGSNEQALAVDDLHPSAFQYGEWVKAIHPVVSKLIEE